MRRFYAMILALVAGMMGLAMLLPASEAAGGNDAVDAPNMAGHVSAHQEAEVVSDNGMATQIQRDETGQFHLSAVMNGQDTRFLVDTGADTVALTIADAEAAGIDFDPESFEPMIRSASGVGKGATVFIERIEIAGRELENVEAVVIEGLDTNLLGQSLLRQLGSVQLRGDTMVIQPD